MAIVEGQMINVKWGSRNKKWFEEKGYIFTNIGDVFEIEVKHLTKGSQVLVEIICDYCGKYTVKDYCSYLNSRKKINKDCCSDCSIEKRKEIIESAQSTYDDTKKIYLNCVQNNTSLPNNFWSNITDENKIRLLKFIFEEYTDFYQYNFENLNRKLSVKYKINPIMNKMGKYSLLNFVYPDKYVPWDFKQVNNEFWKSDDNKKWALSWFVDKLKKDLIINSEIDLPKTCTYKLFEEYNLGGLVAKHFNHSPYEAINFLYPNRFNFWEFYITRSGFHDDNRAKEILNYFIDQLFKDEIIHSIDDIPSKVNIDTFRDYGFSSLLYRKFNGVTFQAFNFLFPNKWKVWEFRSCPTGFWDDESNIKDAVDWLLEKVVTDGIVENKEDIVDLSLHCMFEHYGLNTIFSKTQYNIKDFLIENYKDIFTEDNLNINIAKDRTKMLSRWEVVVHNYLIDVFKSVNYYSTNKLKLYNKKHNENYTPDWIVDGDKVIELYGMYNETNENHIFKNYREKTHRKNDFYKTLKEYKFIDLYPEDIKNNLQGVKEKLAPYIKQLQEV